MTKLWVLLAFLPLVCGTNVYDGDINYIINADIIDSEFAQFDNITSVTGFVQIYGCNNITFNNIIGFNSLETIGTTDNLTNFLSVIDNTYLQTISGFSSLTDDISIFIQRNDNLKHITGFDALQQTDKLIIKNNPLLTTIQAFESLLIIYELEINNTDLNASDIDAAFPNLVCIRESLVCDHCSQSIRNMINSTCSLNTAYTSPTTTKTTTQTTTKTTTQTTTQTTTSDDSDSSLSASQLSGIVVGSFIGVIMVCAVIMKLRPSVSNSEENKSMI
jgi:hypothetical protein